MKESNNKNTTAWQIIKDNNNTGESKRFPDKFFNENGAEVHSTKLAAQEQIFFGIYKTTHRQYED